MNLTKDRVNAIEGYLSAPDIALPSEEKEALHIAAELIEFWKSKQPKVCKHCGSIAEEHLPREAGRLQCFDQYSNLLETSYEEAP